MDRELKRPRSRSPRRPSSGRVHNVDKMVYISNIPYDVRWMELKDMVREKAGDVLYVEMIENMDGKSKGCAVVEFKDPDVAKKCVENMHRMQVRDRNIIVKEIRDPDRFFKKVKDETGVDFMANCSYAAPQQQEEDMLPPTEAYETYGLSPLFLSRLNIQPPLTNRVFVSNVPYTCGTNKLRDLFSIAGKVCFIELPIDKMGKSKGVAVIEYSHPIEAVQAVSMLNGQKYYDKLLGVRIDTMRKKPVPDFRASGDLPVGLKGVGQGLGANGMPLIDLSQVLGPTSSSPSSKMFNSATGGGGGSGGGDFGQLRGSVSFVDSRMMQQQSSATPIKGPGASFAPAAASYAMSPNAAAAVAGSNAAVAYGTTNQPSSVGMGAMVGGGANLNQVFANVPINGGSYRNLPSLLGGPASYESMGGGVGVGGLSLHSSTVSPGRFVVIRNLPPDYTWQTLRDRLRSFGELEHACIVQPGIGRVRFKHSRDAERAVGTLNGMLVEGRPIAVDLAVSD